MMQVLEVFIPKGVNRYHPEGGWFKISHSEDREFLEKLKEAGLRFNPTFNYRIKEDTDAKV